MMQAKVAINQKKVDWLRRIKTNIIIEKLFIKRDRRK